MLKRTSAPREALEEDVRRLDAGFGLPRCGPHAMSHARSANCPDPGLAVLASCSYTAELVTPDAPVTAAPVAPAAPPPVKETKPMPPPTRTQLIKDTIFGTPVEDPYRWLENEKSPEVQAWMKAQDDFARAQLTKLPGRDALLARYKELYYVESVGIPVKRGGRYFYTRTHKDKEKAVVYWRQGAKGDEKVLLDPNTWSTDNTVSLGMWAPSWDGKKVVFAEKPNAADESTLYVLDVDTGKRSEVDVIPGGQVREPLVAARLEGLRLRVAAHRRRHPRQRAPRLLRGEAAQAGRRSEDRRAAAPAHRRPEDLPRRQRLPRRQVPVHLHRRAAGTRTTSSSSASARTRTGSCS